jgi:hypothetical protein
MIIGTDSTKYSPIRSAGKTFRARRTRRGWAHGGGDFKFVQMKLSHDKKGFYAALMPEYHI